MHIRRSLLAAAVAMFVALWLVSSPALAQDEPPGAELVIYDDVAGPYHVKVTQIPGRAIVGLVRLVVEPTDAGTGEPVPNAVVRIFGTPPESGDRQYSPGLNSPADRTLYFGQLELDKAGVWGIDVEVNAAQGQGLAVTQATINPRARSGENTIVGTVVFILVSVGFVGAGTWLWYSSKKARKKRAAIRERGGTPRRSSG